MLSKKCTIRSVICHHSQTDIHPLKATSHSHMTYINKYVNTNVHMSVHTYYSTSITNEETHHQIGVLCRPFLHI